jgi:tetratricopeptide (TPR) repeat protein
MVCAGIRWLCLLGGLGVYLVFPGGASAVEDAPPLSNQEVFEQRLETMWDAITTGTGIEDALKPFISAGMASENRRSFVSEGKRISELLPAEASGELRIYLAMAYSYEHDYPGAERILLNLQEEYEFPGTRLGYRARYRHALLFVEQERYEESEPILSVLWENVEQVQPELRNVLGGQLVDVLAILEKWDRVIDVATSPFAAQDLNSVSILYQYEDLGKAYMETGQFDLALATYEDLAALAKNFEQDEWSPFTDERVADRIRRAQRILDAREASLKGLARAAVQDLEKVPEPTAEKRQEEPVAIPASTKPSEQAPPDVAEPATHQYASPARIGLVLVPAVLLGALFAMRRRLKKRPL